METSEWLNKITRALTKELPGRSAHLQMAPPWRRDALHPEAHYRPSAVLLLLYPWGETLYFPLIRRSSTMNHHANQIGLPGGALEPGENPETAALREAQEELGIEPSQVSILGRLSPLGLSVSSYTIVPIVGFSEMVPHFRPNLEEVAHWFPVPLSELLNRNSINTINLEDGREAPAYRLSGEIVWGATAMILAEFTQLLTLY